MKIVLKDVRLAFPTIWEPKAFEDGSKPRFSAVFLVEPGSANDKLIETTISAVAKETFGAKFEKQLEVFRNNSQKFCYLDGDLKDYDGFAGMKYISCHSQTRPKLIDRQKNPTAESDGILYGGCYVNAVIDIWGQKGRYPGIRASFSTIQFYRDGEHFTGSSNEGDEDLLEEYDGDGVDDLL